MVRAWHCRCCAAALRAGVSRCMALSGRQAHTTLHKQYEPVCKQYPAPSVPLDSHPARRKPSSVERPPHTLTSSIATAIARHACQLRPQQVHEEGLPGDDGSGQHQELGQDALPQSREDTRVEGSVYGRFNTTISLQELMQYSLHPPLELSRARDAGARGGHTNASMKLDKPQPRDGDVGDVALYAGGHDSSTEQQAN